MSRPSYLDGFFLCSFRIFFGGKVSDILKLDDFHDREYQVVLARLYQARKKQGLTQAEVAAKLGKPQSFVARSETGERRIDIIELKAFAGLYNKKIDWFLRKDIND